MSKHTKGPWNNYAGDDIYCVYDAAGKKICSIEPVDIVGWNAVHRDEAEANEALIAAAPELLEALEAICLMQARNYGDATQTHLDFPELVVKARAVIAKARGEA